MDQPTPLSDYEHEHVVFPGPFALDCGQALDGMAVAFCTYGVLNAARSNAVLVCHALTGDQYVAGRHPVTGRPGWWDAVVGPARAIDPARFFVICANVLGSCIGSTGPRSLRPDRRAVGHRLPAGHHPRHGAGAKTPGGAFRHRPAVRRGGRLDGRDAGAGVGRDLPGRRVRRRADRHRAVPLGAEHRLPRGRAPGDLRRPGLSTAAATGRAAHPGPRPGGGADGGAHHLPVRAGADPQVRPPAAERRRRGAEPVRRHVRGGELPAPPGQHASSAGSTPTPT